MVSFDWQMGDPTYPEIEIDHDHVAGLSQWLEKMAELAVKHGGEWNLFVADLWPNDAMSRLIGHVQKSDVAIGYDTGFRVCAYLSKGGIIGDKDGGHQDLALAKKWLEQALQNETTQKAIKKLHDSNAFNFKLSAWGDESFTVLAIQFP